jgi:predicted DNA-binding protein (MmcQ/YjbR family)
VTYRELLAYCLANPGAWEDEPWEGDVVVNEGIQKRQPVRHGRLEPPRQQPATGVEPTDAHYWIPSKVAERIFAFLGDGTSVGVKCGANRDEADEWLLAYPEDASVMAYIGRSGWNTLRIGGAIADDEVSDAIDDSYAMVVAKLPIKRRPPTGDVDG